MKSVSPTAFSRFKLRCSPQRRPPLFNLPAGSLRYSDTPKPPFYNSRKAAAIGSRAARIAGSKPPIKPISVAQIMPRMSS